jgi:hypothetical protein
MLESCCSEWVPDPGFFATAAFAQNDTMSLLANVKHSYKKGSLKPYEVSKENYNFEFLNQLFRFSPGSDQ